MWKIALPVFFIFEIYILYKVAALIGIWPVLGMLLGFSIFGLWLMFSAKSKPFAGKNPQNVEGKIGYLCKYSRMLCGALFIAPGFVSKIPACLLLIPPLEKKIVQWFTCRYIDRPQGFGLGVGFALLANFFLAQQKTDTVNCMHTAAEESSKDLAVTVSLFVNYAGKRLLVMPFILGAVFLASLFLPFFKNAAKGVFVNSTTFSCNSNNTEDYSAEDSGSYTIYDVQTSDIPKDKALAGSGEQSVTPNRWDSDK